MATTTSLESGFAARRSIYALSSSSPIPQARLLDICNRVMTHTPSPFNTQGARLVLLLGAQHARLWDMAAEFVRASVPADKHAFLLGKIAGLKAAHGTAMFWDDPAPLGALAGANPLIAPLFPEWTEHSQGMHHYALWTMLEAEGFGANLQHYSMLEQRAREEWGVPASWKLKAQLVFGAPTAGPPLREKKIEPVEGHRLLVHGAA